MQGTVRILLLEDSAGDVELIGVELDKAGLDYCLQHVDSRDGFISALGESAPDLILADYSIPGLDGMGALLLAKELAPGVPVLIVTGSINEETAVKCMKAGAADYVLKTHLDQLVPAVKTTLNLKRRAADKRQTEAAMAMLAAIVESSDDAIISKGLDSTILSWNQGAERIFGYTAAEMIGRSITLLIPPELRHQEEQILESVRQGKRTVHGDTVRQTKDGRRITVSLTVSPVRDASGKIVGASKIARDITEDKLAREQLRTSLKEKELLLQEVHHRVKNNLQVISSLLHLQAASLKNPELLAVLKENQHRIHSMALVHEQLYCSKSLSQIDFAQFLPQLAANLFRSFGVNRATVRLKLEVASLMLGVDVAIPCALIVNELISNAIKYAFPGERSGEILVSLQVSPDAKIRLSVRDDGVGLPQAIDHLHTESLGLRLVHTLTSQLRGTLGVQRDHGTQFTICFDHPRT